MAMIGFHHTGISVPNLDAALAFYCDVMGGEKLSEKSWPPGREVTDRILQVKNVGGRCAWVKIGKAFLELFEFNNCTPREKHPEDPVINHGLTHLAFIVDDLISEIAHLKQKGVSFHSDEPINGGNNSIYTYCRDPFGNVFEIIEIQDNYTLPNNYTEELKAQFKISPAKEGV